MKDLLSRIPALKVTLLFVAFILIIHEADLSLPSLGFFRVGAALSAIMILAILARAAIHPIVGFFGLALAVFLTVLAIFPSSHFSGSHVSKFTDLGRDVVVMGLVVDDPDRDSVKTRFTLELDSIKLSRHVIWPVDGRIQVTFRQPASKIVAYGDRLAIMGRLRRPRNVRNPGEFDFERYLSLRGDYGQMTIRDDAAVVRLDGFHGNRFIQQIVLPVKHHIMDVSHRTLSPLGASVVIGLLVGERSEIPADVIQAFSLTGTIHILSLSGLHVVFISAILMAIFSFFHLPYVPRVVLTIGCIGLYVLIGDSVPPIVRAALMICVVLIGTVLQRRRHIVNSLLVALLMVLFFDPLSIFDIGLQLSFAAVLSIVLIYPRMEGFGVRMGWLRREEPGLRDRAIQLLLVSIAAQIGTMPFTAYYFNKIPLVSLVANVAIVPLSSLAMGLGFLSSVLALISIIPAYWYGQLNDLTVWVMVEVARLASGLPMAYIDFYAMDQWSMLGFYLVLAMGLLWKVRSVRKYGVMIGAGSVALWAWWPVIFNQETTQVAFLDVGQGDCAYVQTASGRTLLIDGGDRSEDYDYGERIVAPFLRKAGVRRLDYVVMSHPHDDHIGGLAHILRTFEVGTVIEPGQYDSSDILNDVRAAIHERRIPVFVARAGDVLAIDGQHSLYFLHPTGRFVSSNRNAPFSVNNSSLVVKMQCAERSFLFMGDAETESLKSIGRYGRLLRSDVIKVGHHGSWNGTTAELVANVQARWAVVSVSAFNKFDHPSPVTEHLFALAGTTVIRTDLNGAAIFETDGHAIRRVR